MGCYGAGHKVLPVPEGVQTFPEEGVGPRQVLEGARFPESRPSAAKTQPAVGGLAPARPHSPTEKLGHLDHRAPNDRITGNQQSPTYLILSCARRHLSATPGSQCH